MTAWSTPTTEMLHSSCLKIRGGKARRRKWPLEETLHFPMNLNDFIVFVENLLLQIVRDHCNRKKEDDYGEKKTE